MQVKAKMMNKQNENRNKREENDLNIRKSGFLKNLQMEVNSKDRQLKDFMYDEYIKDINHK